MLILWFNVLQVYFKITYLQVLSLSCLNVIPVPSVWLASSLK